MRPMRAFLLSLVLIAVTACEAKLDEPHFRRKIEAAYAEANPGWTIRKREPTETVFGRGDQLDRLDTLRLFVAYEKTGKPPSHFLDAYIEKERAAATARRRTIEQAADDIIPILKSGKWVDIQDFAAIGPERIRDQIRPWRQEVTRGLYTVLGVPEAKLGFRFASIEEITKSEKTAEAWVELAVQNLERQVGTSTGAEMRDKDGRLLVYDLPNHEGVSGLLLSPRFRKRMLQEFRDLPELGAAAPLRNVLIIFDSGNTSTLRPVRHRTHQLYDTQNHFAFRGLLRFDEKTISVFEPPDPKAKTE